MSAPTHGSGCFQIQQQTELKVHVEVLKSYWDRCIQSSTKGCDTSEISCYILLIAKLLRNDKFVLRAEEEADVHILFEIAIEMDMFNNMLNMLDRFSGERLDYLKEAFLQFFDSLFSCSCYDLFLKEEFLIPMMCIINLCSHHSSLKMEHLLLQTCNSICVALHHQNNTSDSDHPESKMNRKALFWGICLNPCAYIQNIRSERPKSLNGSVRHLGEMRSICDLLVNYVNRDGSLCWVSRDSLILLFASSFENEKAGYHMANNSKLCEVLVTDMVLLFTNAPRQLISGNSPEEWPSLLEKLETQMLKGYPLQKFLDHYGFCCSMLDISSHLVKANMLGCFYKGFLLPVLVAALQSTSEPELATATVYLERILLKSRGSMLLPFLLRFLFSERNSTYPGCMTPHTFRHGVTEALERSFPLSETPFYPCLNEFLGGPHVKTHMDTLLKRIQYCNSLVGIASLYLMNTIIDLLCEDVAFELMLKYLLPIGAQSTLGKLVANPSTLFASAEQYLSLIPPYSSFIDRSGDNVSNKRQSGPNGDLSTFHVDGAFVAKFDVEMIEQHGTNSLCSEYYENRMRSYLEEARKLIAERKAACADWCFSYELGNPPPSMAAKAHIDVNLLAPLPQEGLQTFDNASDGSAITNTPKVLQISDSVQWEMDGLNPTLYEEDNILADLERFSALLREPPHCTYFHKSMGPIQSTIKFHRHYEMAPDPEDVKRTSSLYDITYVEVDPDEVTESAEVGETSYRMIARQSSTSSTASTPSRSMELNFTESSELLLEDMGKIVVGDVLDLMRYLDRIPVNTSKSVYGESVETRFTTFIRQFDSQIGNDFEGESKMKERNIAEQVDSGFASVDSALMKALMVNGTSVINQIPFYPGPFLTSVMQLISHIPTNHLYANLQVTQLVIHLLALPLPLIRLQLLPFSMQETADSNGQWFFTTLTTVRQWFDCFINLHSSDFEVASGSRISLANLIDSIRETVFGPPQYSHAEYPISNAAVTTKENSKRMTWLLSRFRLNSSVASLSNTQTIRTALKSSSPSRSVVCEVISGDWRLRAMKSLAEVICADAPNTGPLKTVKDAKSRSVLVALFIFEEFCRELAALCLEHTTII